MDYRCPNCSNLCTDEDLSCSSCGIVFAKWLKVNRAAQKDMGYAAPVKREDEPSLKEQATAAGLARAMGGSENVVIQYKRTNSRMGCLVWATVAAAFAAAFAYRLSTQKGYIKQIQAEQEEHKHFVRDPNTGELRMIRVENSVDQVGTLAPGAVVPTIPGMREHTWTETPAAPAPPKKKTN